MKLSDTYTLIGEDINTLVCNSFSEGYIPLFDHITTSGHPVSSRIGNTREVLNFKTVICQPQRRCTVSLGRNANIFFHLAESLWVLSGRNDLAFITLFNSRFPDYSDDGITLHGAYGRRLRHGGNADLERPGDQLFTLCKRLHFDPDLRRSVISLWDSHLDLGKPWKDIPCNTQLMFRVSEGALHTTVINRSNDLHWGLVANIFQFSFLSEIMALIINRKFVRQTHFSQSLHYYLDNTLNDRMISSDIAYHFNKQYPAELLVFPFKNTTTDFDARFAEIDLIIQALPEALTTFAKGKQNLDSASNSAELFRESGESMYDIARLLFLYIAYQQEKSQAAESVRHHYIGYLKSIEPTFRHKDFWAMAMNYFIARSKDTALIEKFDLLDVNLGNY